MRKLENLLKQAQDLIDSWNNPDSREIAELVLQQKISQFLQENAIQDVVLLSHLQKFSRQKKMTNIENVLAFIAPIERYLGQLNFKDAFIATTVDKSQEVSRLPLAVILHNIRSAHNVGSLVRSCEAFGATEVFFTGYTATTENAKVLKSSLHSQEFIACRSHRDILTLFDELRHKKYQIIGLETVPDGHSIWQINLKKPTAFVLGNERYGLEKNILHECDLIAYIPLMGQKNSLNVAVAGGIALTEYVRQQK